MMTPSAPIPTTVLTGFLGAGKTTIIRNILKQIHDRRIALIINEFGDIAIDGDLLRGCGNELCRDEDIIELANGCICCTVADDFIPTMTRLLDQTPQPDHILIETSGLALPDPLIQAFNWPEVRSRITLDGVITVVDGAALADGHFATDSTAVKKQQLADPSIDHENPIADLFEDQMLAADMIILNKTDLLNVRQQEDLKASLSDKTGPAVQIVSCESGNMDINVLLGINAERLENGKDQNDVDFLNPDHEPHEHDHSHDDFETLHLILDCGQDRPLLLERLEQIIREHNLLRVKGFIFEKGKQMRLVVQAAGPRLSSYYDRQWREDEPMKSELVIIGRNGLDRKAITNILDR